jgi:hypothetical protein
MWKIFSVPCGSALYKFHCIDKRCGSTRVQDLSIHWEVRLVVFFCNPIHSADCVKTYTVACRRVFSSAPLKLIGSRLLLAFGNETVMRKAFHWKRSRISL